MSEDIPRKQHSRYYEDSDDMVERIRRLRAAFEKKINSFQGVDWPYYEKRVIVGKKKKDEAPTADPSLSGAGESKEEMRGPTLSEASPASPVDCLQGPPNDSLPSGETSAWWAAQRRVQKTAAARARDKKSLPLDGGGE
jgi:hypothetical protein